MDDWLIFQYHLIRAQPESEELREPFGATDPLCSRAAKGGRRRVARPRRWLSWGKCVGRSPRQIREIIILRHDAEPLKVKRVIPCCREKPLASG
jgi:hypothetical protein